MEMMLKLTIKSFIDINFSWADHYPILIFEVIKPTFYVFIIANRDWPENKVAELFVSTLIKVPY